MATSAPTMIPASSRRRDPGSPAALSRLGRRLHSLPAPGIGATAASLSSVPAPAYADPIRPTAPQRALAYLATGSLPPVLGALSTASTRLSLSGLTLLCGAAGYLLGSAFA